MHDSNYLPTPRSKYLRGFLLGVIIFSAGFVIGGVVAGRVFWERIHDKMMQPDLMTERIVSKVDDTLELDPNQQERVHEIIIRHCQKIDELRWQVIPMIKAEQDSLAHEVARELQPHQLEQWHEFLKQIERFRPPFMKEENRLLPESTQFKESSTGQAGR